MDPVWRIEPVAATDWRQLRAIRLEMLADSPLAFVEASADAARQSEEQWQSRTAQYARAPEHAEAVVDSAAGDTWGGLARTALYDEQRFLLSVYVTPRLRASGAADALIGRIEDWVRADGGTELYLHVMETNARARAVYERRGYQATGQRERYPLDETRWEIEMRRPL